MASTERLRAYTEPRGPHTDRPGAYAGRLRACSAPLGASTEPLGACSERRGAYTKRLGARSKRLAGSPGRFPYPDLLRRRYRSRARGWVLVAVVLATSGVGSSLPIPLLAGEVAEVF